MMQQMSGFGSFEASPKKRSNGLLIAVIVLCVLFLSSSLFLFLTRNDTPTTMQGIFENSYGVSPQESLLVGAYIQEKRDRYGPGITPGQFGEFVVVDTYTFDEKMNDLSVHIDPQAVKKVPAAAPLIFMPPIGEGIPAEGLSVFSGQPSQFVLDYQQYANENQQINITQDVILYGPDGSIIPEASYKDFMKLDFDASQATYVPIVNQVKIPTSYPEGTYVLELTIHDLNDDTINVIRTAFNVVRELRVSTFFPHLGEENGEFISPENFTFHLNSDIYLYAELEGFQHQFEEGTYQYTFREDLVVKNESGEVYSQTDVLTMDQSYDEKVDVFTFRNEFSLEDLDAGMYTFEITITDLKSGEIARGDTFVLIS